MLGKWLLLLIAISAGVGFYWLRYKHLLVYGLSEVFIAVVLMIVTIFPAETYNIIYNEPSSSDVFIAWITRIATMFGAVYVFVRGLDNIDTALPSSTWHSRWNWAKQAIRRLLNI